MNFNELTEALNTSMMNRYVSVNKSKNPVFIDKDRLSVDELSYILGQYTLFTKNIVHFLYAARNTARAAKWKAVDVELTRNLGEELGTETDCITHNNMLILGIKETAKIDLNEIQPKSATQIFIDKMIDIMSNDNAGYSSGAAYAMESSAIPELRIVIELVKMLAAMENSIFSQRLEKFFDGHLNVWEEAHESCLKEACTAYVRSEDEHKSFENGFREVMKTMDKWWTGLREEAEEFI